MADIADRVTTRNVEGHSNVLTISAEFGLISQSEFFSRRVASESVTGYFLLEEGDFAYNKSYSRGYPLGAIRRLDRYEKGCVSPLYICFRPRRDAVHSGFLLHYLDGGVLDAGLANVAKEGVRNHGLLNVGVADFFGLEVPLPPIAEQEMTAKVLDTLDTTIRQTEAIIEKLKQVKQGLLHDLLTRGVDANGELRPPLSLAPHLYKESSLGLIPRDWGVEAFGDLCESSAFGPRFPGDAYDENGPLATLRTTDMDDEGNIDLSTMPRAAIDPTTFSDHLLRPGDLVISRSGTCGVSGVFNGHSLEVVPGAFLIRFRLLEQRHAQYFRRYFNSAVGRPRLTRLAVGGVQKNIKGSDVLRLMVAVPPPSEALACQCALDALERRQTDQQLEFEKLKRLKSGLMDDLLTGRVRVTPLLDPAAV